MQGPAGYYSKCGVVVSFNSDDGNGFNTQEVPKGFGLTSANSRVKEIGGLLELSSTAGEGTIVQITLPRTE
jgi:signal transduction histidine kinase